MEEARALAGNWSTFGTAILFSYILIGPKKWRYRNVLQFVVSGICAVMLGISFWLHPDVWENGISITMVFFAAAMLLFGDALWKIAKETIKAPE